MMIRKEWIEVLLLTARCVQFQVEAAAIGVLESIIFYEDSAVEMDGLLLDVVDYSVRQLVPLAAQKCPDSSLDNPQKLC